MNKHNSVPNIRFNGFEANWIKEKLGNIATVEMNKRIYKSQTNEDGEIPFYKIRTFGKKADSFISNKLFNEYKKKYPYPKVGDILISASGTIGNTVIYKGEDAYFQDSNIVWLNVNHKIILNSFLYNFYKIVHWKGLEGSTIKRLYNSNILSTSINYPSITEQQKIGNFFTKLDKLLDLQQQKIDKLELLKKALLQKLFPKHDAQIPELRFKGFNDEWKSYLLGKIAVFINGRAFKQNELLDKGKYPVLRVGNFYTNDKWFYSDLELPEKLYANKGDLLYTWSATFGPHIWKGDKVIYHYHIWKIIFSSEVSKQFALQMLLNDKEELMNNTNGSTMIHLTKNEMEKKVVKIPIKPEQQKIGNLLSKVDQLIELENKKLQNFQQVKKCLLQNMFVE